MGSAYPLVQARPHLQFQQVGGIPMGQVQHHQHHQMPHFQPQQPQGSQPLQGAQIQGAPPLQRGPVQGNGQGNGQGGRLRPGEGVFRVRLN